MSKKPGIAPSLSREAIIDIAFDLIDEHGYDAFSLRSLATHLGISAMGIYTYFDSKDDIISGVQEKMRTFYDNAPVPGERWDDTLRRTLRSIRKVGVEHSNIWRVDTYGWQKGTRVHTRRIYKIHKDQGMPLEIYKPLWSIIEAFLGGFIQKEISQMNTTFEPLDPDDPDYQWMLISQTAYTDESFRDGIELIISGVRRMAAPDPCEWRTPLS